MTMQNSRRARLAGGAASAAMAAALLYGSGACAQATPAPAAPAVAPERSATVEEVLVTARRREENLQDTPISITAFTQAGLEQQAVQNVSQIALYTPNLQFSPSANVSGASSASSIFIRGIGQSDFTLTTEPGVGLYLDGVYIARSVGGVLDLVDIERIEVLRGPQGTLFGKNTIGGAISVTTVPPASDFSGQAEVTYGSFNRIDAKATINAPLSDKVLTKLSVASLNDNGYARRIIAGDRLGGHNDFMARGAVRLLPSDNVTLDLTVDYTRDRDDSVPTTMLAAPADPTTLGAPILFFLNSSLPPSQQYTFANYATGDPFTTKGTGPNISDIDIWGVSGVLNWDLGGGVNLKSITAYRDLSSHFGRDADNSPLLFVHTEDFYDQHQFSQELQFGGAAAEGRLKWLAGAFYFKEDGDNVNLVALSGAFGTALGLPPAPAFTIHSGGRIHNTSLAGFAQATLQVTEPFSITAGLRYTSEKKAFDPDQFVEEVRAAGIHFVAAGPGPLLLLDPLISSQRVEDTFNELSPKLSFEYKWSPDVLTYLSYSTGFKGGGFDQRIFPGRYIGTPPNVTVLTAPEYGPEKAKVYEAGLKLTGFDNRARFNVAAFHTEYDDLQVVLLNGIAPQTQNGGHAKIDGFEAELQAVPAQGLNINAGLGYTDARYTELDPRVALAPGNQLFLSNDFPNTSRWTASVSATYTFEVGGGSELAIHGDWAYRSSYFLDAANNPELHQSGVGLLNASATLYLQNGVSLQAGGRNLADKRYLISGNVDLTGIGYAEGTFARPREWFATARYKF